MPLIREEIQESSLSFPEPPNSTFSSILTPEKLLGRVEDGSWDSSESEFETGIELEWAETVAMNSRKEGFLGFIKRVLAEDQDKDWRDSISASGFLKI